MEAILRKHGAILRKLRDAGIDVNEVRRALSVPADLMTIDEFCLRHSISRPTFYREVRNGTGPQLTHLGPQMTRISIEAAAEWRARRQQPSEEAERVMAERRADFKTKVESRWANERERRRA